MFRNHLRIAWRNLFKYKGYSAINIIGLASGMAVAILITLWISDEMSFNKYHRKSSKLAYVMSTQTFNQDIGTFNSIVVPLEQELRVKHADDYAGLSLTWKGDFILSQGEKKISETGFWAQPDLPGMLTLNMLAGNYESFKDPSTMLLSASLSKSLFGSKDPVGQIVKVNNKTEMKVGGIYEDLPLNTDYTRIKMILPWYNKDNFWNTQTDAWSNHGCHLLVELRNPRNINTASSKIRMVTQQHGYITSNEQISLFPMEKWHLYSEFTNGISAGGRIKFVWIFGITGVFILLLACINFMNLSTARSEKRSREVGIRKSIGSNKGQLIKQFLTESLMMSMLAAVVAMAIIFISLPFFNAVAEKNIRLPWSSGLFWLAFLGFAALTGLIAGSYPAFYLSSFQPIKVLKGNVTQGKYSALPRKILVVGQFTVSIMLIIGTLVVYRQVQFAKMRPIGYNSRGLITVPMNTPELFGHYDLLRNDLINSGGAIEMAQANSKTTNIFSNNSGFSWAGKQADNDPLFGTIAVSHDFGHTIGWQVIEGRDFSRNFNDSGAFILNESAVKIAGIKNPIGKTMRWLDEDHVITGVVRDMIMNSPFDPIVPIVFHLNPDWARFITIRLSPAHSVSESLQKIEKVFSKHNPGSPFIYQFASEDYGKKFSDEERVGKLVKVFAILAIFISCLGLYGLASFVAEQRTKEIGVRKVLGASVFSLWQLLSKEFVLLVGIACIIAIPLAFTSLSAWLENYKYRTSLEWWIFGIAVSGGLAVTILTVSIQALKAGMANPIRSLRSE